MRTTEIVERPQLAPPARNGGAPQPSDQRREKVTLILALVSCCPGTIGVEAAESSAASR
jgi:hypothetical protein